MVLIGTSMQAPRRYDVDDESNDHLNEQASQDETTSRSTISSVNENELSESTRDESQENSDSEADDDNEDSVASFVKKSVVNKPQIDKVHQGDSVASYIALKDNGAARSQIPQKNEEENDDSGASNDDDGSNDDDDDGRSNGSEPLGIKGDSVAAYISQDTGISRHEIPKKTNNDEYDEDKDREKSKVKELNSDSKKDTRNESPLEDDSVASYISVDSGSPRYKIPASNDKNEPISSNKPNTNVVGSKSDSVGSYIDLVDNDKQQSPTNEASGEELESSGEPQDEEDQKSQKAQEILEGLENLSTEKKSKPQNQWMNDLSPDVIIPHQMVGELWMERSAYAPQVYSPPVVTASTTSYPYQMNNMQYIYQPPQPQYTYVDITRAAGKGAVCLDGSTPGFFFRQGLNTGAKNWIIYLQGGAWCHSKIDCYHRSKSNLGSSLKFNNLVNVEGLLSRNPQSNPNFYNWNAVYVPYCDGASYTGNRTKPLTVRGRKIYFRGKRILSALLDDLLDHGLNDAEKVVFSGTSAGGLAVLLHADYVRSRIPTKVNVYSLSDAGIFLNAANLKKQMKFGALMSDVFKLHGSSSCVSKRCKKHVGKADKWKCMFPQHFGKYIKSPVFIVNPLYDSWQLGNVIGIKCAKNLHKCSTKEMAAVINFRKQTLKALEPLIDNPHISLFADSCFDHGQIIFGPKWNAIRVKNRSMSGSFVRWMMKEEHLRNIVDPDSDELFNPTCVTHQMKFSKKSFLHS